VKICLPKSKGCPQNKVKVDVLNLSNKVKSLDILECESQAALCENCPTFYSKIYFLGEQLLICIAVAFVTVI
jgi:hypothetical protein